MQSSGAFIPLIHSQLAELKKICGSIFHRSVRESIASAELYLQNIKPTDKLNLKESLTPFFTAFEDDHKLFQTTVLDCFYKIFSQSSSEVFPDRDLTCQIINVLIKFDKSNLDELNLTCCNVCISCLRSPSGVHFCHGALLRKMFKLLFRIYNNCENSTTFNSIKASIHEALLALFDTYTKPVELAAVLSVTELAQLATSILFENSLSIRKYLGPILENGDYTPTIRDVDVFSVLSLMSRIIEVNKLKLRTIKLAANFLIFCLKQKSPFFERNAFRLLLESKIHLACLSLALDNRMDLAVPTTDLLITIWSRFATLYTEGFNAILVKGLQTTLTSPEQSVIIRSLKIYKKLSEYPQLFVDAFVNYDCDRSGFFDNVWENTLNLIVKLAYPNINKQSNSEVQLLAIDVVDSFLNELWVYHEKFHDEDKHDISQEAETPEDFFKAKKEKDEFSKGLHLFKQSFKKGLKFFIEKGFCKDNPQSIADFLWENPALDPGEVGQLIGDKDRVETLKCFTNHFDFKNLSFEQAFRQFLQKFQIPGEAQMIDRVMEQFGSKFYNDNPTLFSCADTVYVLAFSALMLHTDAFHPNVKSRMTLEQFLQNNKGIDNGQDMPVEFLTDLYRGITSKQIYVANSKSNSIISNNSSLLTREQRAGLYESQCEATLNEARNNTNSSTTRHTFHKSESPLFIGPMFQSIWGGALAVLTMTFEKSDEPKIYKQCLNGLSNSVHIASHCFIESALDTLVDSFGTFTSLRKGLREAKPKNIECTNSLLKIALEDKNFLRGAWEIVMGEISAVERLKDVQKDFRLDDMTELFSSTPELDKESIVDFIRAMCQTSNQELNETPPRNFLLEQLRIVAVNNMQRPRFIWLQIWEIIGDYLFNISCSQNIDIAYMGIGTLQQITNEFLNQQELTQFHFQQHFMSPFQKIFEKQVLQDAKDYVIFSLKDVVTNAGSRLQSGWSVIFELLTVASIEPKSQKDAFELLSILASKYLEIISSVDFISIVSSFITNAENIQYREDAVGYLEDIAKVVKNTDENSWFAILDALGQSGQNDIDQVRVKSHNEFKALLQTIDLTSTILRYAFEVALPLYFEATEFNPHDEPFFTSAIAFMNKLFSELIVPDWEKYKEFEKVIFQCLVKNTLSTNMNLSKATLLIIQNLFSLANSDILIESLTEIASNINKLTIVNARLFLSLTEQFNENSDNEKRFLDVIRKSIETCENKKLYIIWAQSRSALLKSMQKYSEEIPSDIAKCLMKTLQIYIENKFLKNNESSEALAWNQAVVVSLQMLNNMNQNLFQLCFDKSSDSLLTIISAYSSEVRKQVSTAMQRKLL